MPITAVDLVPGRVFAARAADVLEAIAAGVSITDSARANEVGLRTVGNWLAAGRRDPDGPYGDFARAVDAAQAARIVPPPASRSELDEDELRSLVATSARGGSVPAMRLFHDLYLRAAAGEVTTSDDDPLAEVDELARRRAAR